MLQSQEVLVKKTLGKAIEDNNVHPLYVLLVTEMAPTVKDNNTQEKCINYMDIWGGMLKCYSFHHS